MEFVLRRLGLKNLGLGDVFVVAAEDGRNKYCFTFFGSQLKIAPVNVVNRVAAREKRVVNALKINFLFDLYLQDLIGRVRGYSLPSEKSAEQQTC